LTLHIKNSKFNLQLVVQSLINLELKFNSKFFFCIGASLLVMLLYGCCKMSIHSTPDENTLKICPRGGQYTFPGGIVLQVPRGAVSKKMNVNLKFLNPSDVKQSILDDFGFTKENLVAFIDGGSEEINFNLPVKLIIKAKLDTGKIPLLYEVINDSTCTLASNANITADADKNEIIISVKHFSNFFVELIEDLVERIKCGEDPCRCKEYFVEQGDKDFMCSSAKCQITESKLAVTYKSCPGTPKEEFFSREVSDGCIPKLLLSSDQAVIPTNGQTSLKATIKLDCEPLEWQNIEFSIASSIPAGLKPISDITDADGKVISTFTAGDQEGLVAVNAKSEVSFYRYILTATGLEKPVIGPKITKKLTNDIDIHIQDNLENWSGTMSFDYELNNLEWLRELAHYDINFKFYALKENEYGWRKIIGEATSTQKVNIDIDNKCYYYDNLNAPPNLTLLIKGNVKTESNEMWLLLEKENYIRLYDFDLCFDCIPREPPDCDDDLGLLNLFTGVSWATGPWTTVTGKILLGEGTYSGSTITHPFGSHDFFKYVYSIMLHKAE
jgi:hypothetical protein